MSDTPETQKVLAHQVRMKNRRVQAVAAHGDVYLRGTILHETALTLAELTDWRERAIRQRGRITDAELRLSPEAAPSAAMCLLMALRDILPARDWMAAYHLIGETAHAYHLSKCDE